MKGMRERGFLLFLLVFSALLAQVPVTNADGFNYWAKSYGESGDEEIKDVKVLQDGSIIAVGSTTSFGAGKEDVWILKLDKNGNIKWQKTYGGSEHDVATAVTIAENGDIIVAGLTDSFGAGRYDVWIFRLDENGNIKWQKTYGESELDRANAVVLAPKGDVIVTGYTGGDVWVLRLDENGNVKWQKTYGGKLTEVANTVDIAENGDIIVAGKTWSFGAGDADVWVLKLDENGNVKWQKTYGGSRYDGVTTIALAPNGDIIVAGRTVCLDHSSYDVWVLRLDGKGDMKWQKTYGGYDYDGATTVAPADNGDIIVAGYTHNFGYYEDAWVLRLPPDGNLPGFSRDSNAKITIPTPRVMDSQATIENSSATSQDSHAYPNPVELTVKTQYGPMTLTINSTPSGAEVYVDGGYKGTTPLTVQVYSGTHTIKLTKQDYENYTMSATLKPEESKTLNITLTPAFSYLTVYSDPTGAKVYVDGSYIGDTPVENYKLLTEQHVLKITKHDYEDYTTRITLNPGESKNISATLTSYYAYLSVDSSPSGASVYVDTNYAGKTPLNDYRVSPGEHTVKVLKDGYDEFTKTVTISLGEKAHIIVGLTIVSSSTTTTTPTTTTTSDKDGICGPATLVGLAIIPLLLGRRR